MKAKYFAGVLLGTAVGDSVGLPYEGLPPRSVAGILKRGLRQRLAFGRGMASDDTEQTLMVAQALVKAGGDSRVFTREFARRYRWWIAMLPAGVGGASLRAGVKLLLGFSPFGGSGVFSAGNAPAMRSAVIGVFYRDDPARRREFVQCATRMTHTDPKALTGALAVAEIAALEARGGGADFQWEMLVDLAPGDAEWRGLLDKMQTADTENKTVREYAATLGLSSGVGAYVYHTVAAAVYAWRRHRNGFQAGSGEVIRCGGDTDTTAAIAGALIGTAAGARGIPRPWLANYRDCPYSSRYILQLARRLARPGGQLPPCKVWAVPFRNVLFLIIILCHIAIRLPRRIANVFR